MKKTLEDLIEDCRKADAAVKEKLAQLYPIGSVWGVRFSRRQQKFTRGTVNAHYRGGVRPLVQFRFEQKRGPWGKPRPVYPLREVAVGDIMERID